MKSIISLAFLAAVCTAAPQPVKELVAKSAAAAYPAALLLGATIEGCSVDSAGQIHAVNKTHFVSLSDATISKPLLVGRGGETSHYASSRFTRTLSTLVGDAVAHQFVKLSGRDAFMTETKMLQPNDFTVSGDEKRIYLSGMNYTANKGDLWFYNVTDKKAYAVPPPDGSFRMNGIDLSPDDKTLYVTSAENNATGAVVSAKIWKFDIDGAGMPCNPTVAIDLYDTLTKQGLEPKKAGMDPDGMRMDTRGTLFITLNAFGKVLAWDTKSKTGDAKVINLETVAFPSNLELGGKDGKELVVIGRCKGGEKSCVDCYKHTVPGRAYTNLQQKGDKECADEKKQKKTYA